MAETENRDRRRVGPPDRGRPAAGRSRARGKGARLVRRDRLRLVFRGLPRFRLQPAPVRGTARGVLAREHADPARGAAGAPDLAALDVRGDVPRCARSRPTSSATSTRTATCGSRARRSGRPDFDDEADVEAALALVRSLDPSGRRRLRPARLPAAADRALGIENPLIEKIIREHWPEFLNRQFAPLARTLGVGMSEIQAVVEIIKNLEPKPGRKYSSERTIYVEPDVFVRKIGDEYVIQLNEDGLPKLRISAAYRQLLQRRERSDRRGGRHLPQGQDALGGLAHQEPRPAPAHDLQGRRLDRAAPARVPRPRHRAPAAARAARRGQRHRDARVDGLPRRLEQVHPHAARHSSR